MDLASFFAQIRHVFGDTFFFRRDIGALSPVNYIAQCFTRVKTLNLFPVDENRLQQCCAAPHEQCCQQHVATLLSITRCNNIVDNNVHGVQHNIVEACSHQLGTTCAFLAVYYTQQGPVYTRPDSHGHDIKFSPIKAILAPKFIKV